jgi:hypothetical protein
MPWIEPHRRRYRLLTVLAAWSSLCLSGCSSFSNGLSVFSPYRASQQPEEYRSPPAQDTRYTEPPSYPSHLLKPVYKPKEDAQENFRKTFGAGGMGPSGY